MEAFFSSLGLVALAEIGDKTQLLAAVLAVRFRRPLPIAAGILVATLANHFCAALLGTLAADLLSSRWFQAAVGLSFLAMAAWTLVPDDLDEGDARLPARGAFVATLIAFFLVEMGDKTQVATVALGARFAAVALVTAGTTAGMMLANLPVVLLGDRLLARLPMRAIHRVAAALFAALGAWTLWTALAA